MHVGDKNGQKAAEADKESPFPTGGNERVRGMAKYGEAR